MAITMHKQSIRFIPNYSETSPYNPILTRTRSPHQTALEAEINRLRVTLFPETKTAEYTFPSDVVRPRGADDATDDSNDASDISAELDDADEGV